MEPARSREPQRIREMFGAVARRYDLLNHLLSANLDRGWRRKAAAEIPDRSGLLVLDLCGGTGDLTLELARRGRARHAVCCDFAHPMLELAGRKFRRKRLADRCSVLEADGLRLPFAAASFDAVTIAFGIRNLCDMNLGLREILRVLRPAGRMIVLEFSRPTAPVLSSVYRFYLRRVLPRLGDGVSSTPGPYGYLARTIAEFPDPPSLAGRIREAGFAACGWSVLSGGIVAIHTAHKSP